MTRHLFIVRHGHREDFLPPHLSAAWRATTTRPFDPPLSSVGQQQARETAARLAAIAAELPISRIFTSPFLRTIQTAHAAAEALDLPVCIEPGLSEWLNPEWFATAPTFPPVADLQRQFPRLDPTYTPRIQPVYPETSEPEQVWPRTAATLQALLRDFAGNLLLVGHGASVYGLARALAGPDAQITAKMCSIVHFALAPESTTWDCLLNGSTTHLSLTEDTLRFN